MNKLISFAKLYTEGLLIFSALCLLSFAPIPTSKFIKVAAPFALPSQGDYGQTFTFPASDSLDHFLVNGRKPTHRGHQGDFLAGAGLYEPGSISIVGTYRAEPSPWPFAVNTYFATTIPLKRPNQGPPPRLRLPSAVWKKVQRPDPSKQLYRQRMKILKQRDDGQLTTSCWHRPLHSRINSPFGKARILPSGRRYFHSGVDLKAKTGTPLRAIAAGEVVFADHSAIPGHTVMIYHGDGIHSQFMHMSQIQVSEGQHVTAGQLVGLSGSSGRVEGPHLHWELSWKGQKLSPLQFLQNMPECAPFNQTNSLVERQTARQFLKNGGEGTQILKDL